jgi:hypothetical protein
MLRYGPKQYRRSNDIKDKNSIKERKSKLLSTSSLIAHACLVLPSLKKILHTTETEHCVYILNPIATLQLHEK